MKYYVIRLTRTEDRNGYYKCPENSVGHVWYHAGGRGNGAHANLYREDQINRILGQYRGAQDILAEAIEVIFKEEI